MAGITSPTILDSEGRWRDTEDEHLWWPRVLWIDPGTVSGVACVWFDPQALIEGKTLRKCILAWYESYLYGPESGVNGQVSRFMRMRDLLAAETGLATGIERFTLLRLDRSPDFLSPVRIRAAIEYHMSIAKFGGTLLDQTPGDAMNSFTDQRLKALHMFTPGPDHIRDGTRHCLLHLRRLNQSRELIEKVHGIEEGWWE